MFWEDDESKQEFQVSDEIIDLVFNIQCRELPVDHAHTLGQALCEAAPVLREDERCAIHSIHLAGSQNGWERPDASLGQKLILSRRTKMTLRVPAEYEQAICEALDGRTLDIEGDALTIGKAKRKLLSKQGTIFSRYIALQAGEAEDENQFMMRIIKDLQARGIKPKKALAGITLPLKTPQGELLTRSIMLAGLTADESVRLQQQGLGSHREMGCGIFIPHKGIDAVKTQEDE